MRNCFLSEDRSQKKLSKGCTFEKEPSHGGGRRFESDRAHCSFLGRLRATRFIGRENCGKKREFNEERGRVAPLTLLFAP